MSINRQTLTVYTIRTLLLDGEDGDLDLSYYQFFSRAHPPFNLLQHLLLDAIWTAIDCEFPHPPLLY